MSDDLATIMPCGCRRGITKRLAPDIDENGHPKLEDGAFVMKEVEELEESYCSEHTKVIAERQQEVARALAGGTVTSDEALRLISGMSPTRTLTDGKTE